MKFEVSTVVKIHIVDFKVMTLCSLERGHHVSVKQCLSLQGINEPIREREKLYWRGRRKCPWRSNIVNQPEWGGPD
jgi:hypothetical protein